ncbi:uncharacterized protein [Epargyreus clarus]|uniref:uncharacterized protein n=1 Tax=Epargyreus clarus TaxID=520877 RepID=UPI003C2DABAC
MVLYQNFEIYASITLFVVIKIVSELVQTCRASMYDKKANLTSIPEKNESEDNIIKWVPKKKHEVLKAKYKCLKKLFQVYDASVIGILPQNYPDNYVEPERHRRKRSHRTKTDACAGTNEVSSGDVSLSQTEKSAATSVIKDLNLHQFCSTEVSNTTISKINEKSDKSTQDSKEDVSNNSDCPQTIPHPIPYLVYNERRRPTRLQSFINRIFGIKPERRYHFSTTEHVYAASDNNISNRYEKRRRRSVRFRRRRPKKIQSEVALRDVQSPMILSYVQNVQRNCLMDTTPRQCPILGCRMIFYGIINYNDHLNLCHFPDRKYICHYCHEGFSREYDKIVHENEHIGITRVANLPSSPSTARPSVKIASNTQTDPEISKIDVPEEKLKKIVSFFDKISDPDHVLDQIKKNRYSESNLPSVQTSLKTDATESGESTDSEKRSNLQSSGRKCASLADSSVTSNFPCSHRVTCRFCGENFDFRRQLSLHVDLEHRVHDKFSKFHSCPGIVDRKPAVVLEDGRINVHSIDPVTSQSTCYEVSRRKSDDTISCEPSTNIVYYASVESVVKKPSAVRSFVQKIRSYKWEPGSKVMQ